MPLSIAHPSINLAAEPESALKPEAEPEQQGQGANSIYTGKIDVHNVISEDSILLSLIQFLHKAWLFWIDIHIRMYRKQSFERVLWISKWLCKREKSKLWYDDNVCIWQRNLEIKRGAFQEVSPAPVNDWDSTVIESIL